jgi:hypothetical protein
LLVAALAIAVGAFVWLRRPDPKPAAGTGSSGTTSPAAPHDPLARTGSDAPPKPHPITQVRKTSPEARRQLAEQIATARVRARAAGTTAVQAAGGSDDTLQLDRVGSEVMAALQASIPILADCYDDQPGKTAAVEMVIYSDPSLGSVIDTDAMKDQDGKPLSRELDDCLRTTIETLELPPIGSGGRLQLQYSFKFE